MPHSTARLSTVAGVSQPYSNTGPKQRLVFTDRLPVTLVYLRHQLPHAVPALPRS